MKVFELLIYAAVAIALIFLVINIFSSLFPQEDLLKELKQTVILAETPSELGQYTPLINKKVPKDFLLRQTFFELTKRSIAFECSNQSKCCIQGEKCSKPEWDLDFVKFKEQTTTNFYVRCIYDKINICKIYFGKAPAQASIENIELLKENGTNKTIKVVVKNTGDNILLLGNNELKLYKKVHFDFEPTNESFPTQQIESLMPNQEYEFIWNVETKTLGEYQIEAKFSSKNSGFNTKTFDFNAKENSVCYTNNTPGELIYDGNNYWETKYCDGCNYAYECVSAWSNEKPNTKWNIFDKDTTYCIMQNETTSCSGDLINLVTDNENPCKVAPESTECKDWLPNNEIYTCPITPDESIYDPNCIFPMDYSGSGGNTNNPDKLLDVTADIQ